MTGPDPDLGTTVMTWVGTFGNPLTWDDLPWLRGLTDLPIVLKGICHPDDARRALDEGVDGIYCSNHGGRQANGGGAALDWLPGVVEAVREQRPRPDAPVIFDSGVRTGADVVKARRPRRRRRGDRPALRLRARPRRRRPVPSTCCARCRPRPT